MSLSTCDVNAPSVEGGVRLEHSTCQACLRLLTWPPATLWKLRLRGLIFSEKPQGWWFQGRWEQTCLSKSLAPTRAKPYGKAQRGRATGCV